MGKEVVMYYGITSQTTYQFKEKTKEIASRSFGVPFFPVHAL